jgi:hypothetical protein
MNISRVVSWIGFTAAFWTTAGCSSSNNSSPAPSQQGESCTRSSDCASGLACLENICLKRGTVTADAAVGDGSVASEGGTPPTDTTRLGQACATASDCGQGLTCVASAAGGIQGGLCDLASFGITPTGKVCGGECTQASDCCELPPNFGELEVETDAGVQVIHTCGDLLQYAIGGDATVCPTSEPLSTQATACNLFESYCNGCVTNTWACSASNQCVYTGPCSTTAESSDEFGICPTESRTGRTLNLTCTSVDGGTAGTCAPSTGCTTTADCAEQRADNGDLCNGTDCVCFNNACFFQCASNLDCPAGYACDSTSKVCKASGCSSDAACKVQLGNVTATCNATTGNCVVPCKTDHDCSPSSGVVPALGSFTNEVCGTDNTCVSVLRSCSSDNDCIVADTGSSVNTFCITPAPPAGVVSAITN